MSPLSSQSEMKPFPKREFKITGTPNLSLYFLIDGDPLVLLY